MVTEKEILLCFLNGDSQRRIASYLKVSRNTVFRIVSAYMAQELEASDVSGLSGLTSEALHGQYELLELTRFAFMRFGTLNNLLKHLKLKA